MKILTLFRGSAGCGKSTYIEENGLKPYTISADDIRLLHVSPQMTADGNIIISPTKDKEVWSMINYLVEERMKNGDFIVVDATNAKASSFHMYKNLAKQYKYRIVCIDMTDVPIEECKKRNMQRDIYKRVPEIAIDKMYNKFKEPIPSGIEVVKPYSYYKAINVEPIDLSKYKKIHHIGDIHGCNTVLQEYLQGELQDDECYIFTGDWIDRGIENAETLSFLLSIMDKENVILIEGNHDKYINMYAKDIKAPSREFEKRTRQQLDMYPFNKKELRRLYKKFRQLAYYKYNDKQVIVTHGGILPHYKNLAFISTQQMIKGIGGYEEMEKINNLFVEMTHDKVFQIHGHRNITNAPVQVNERCFCLEGQVEFGGYLRAVTLDKNGFKTYEVQNNVFRKTEDIKHNEELLNTLRNNPYIKEKQMDNISSFNFTRKAFKKEIWNEQTLRARGLFINNHTGDIVIRSYDKFFNIGEKFETNMSMLKSTMSFPAKAFVKYNGYLGLVGYDKETTSLLIASKSSLDSDHAQWFENLIYEKLNQHAVDYMIEYIKKNNCTLVWEVIDIINDAHIIKYNESKIVLLNIVYNDIEFKQASYSELMDLANTLDVEYKEIATTLNNWEEFEMWYNITSSKDYKYKNREYIEGFVIEDSNGFMTKLKGEYYSFWKYMRSVKDAIAKQGYSKSIKKSDNPVAMNFYKWCKEQTINVLDKSIIELRDIFENVANENKIN